MVSTWSSGASLSSPTCGKITSEMPNESAGLTFIDFLPKCREPGGLFSKPVFETFRTVVDRANEWHRLNPQWEIKTCESVEFKNKGENVDYEKMTYFEHGEGETWFIRGLRLWIVKRDSTNERIREIGFINIVPEERSEKGRFSTSFERLQDVISKFNSKITENPIPGRIVTIESQEMKMTTMGEFDPDQSNWEERGNMNKRFIFIIRIFFEIMNGIPEEIGVADFSPDVVKKRGIFSLPEYEPFSNVVKKASDWCAQHTGLKFVNAQSLEIKIPADSSGDDVDTQKMHYTEHGSRSTFYIRIVRVAYTKIVQDVNISKKQPSSLTQLTCKTFVPEQLSTGLFVPEFENLTKTKQRISAWVKATGALVVSAETAAVRVSTGGEAKHGPEASFTFNETEKDEYWIFVIRLYLNGQYNDPPSNLLPPLTEIDESCCVLC
ncbi:uncharacterized protein LOC129219042 [Uloborus diversus]|uniref:uncharacterized protein LOC129219042 n=1 Tax=Uloborus diversus TaxID=327109 RepID=UPI00240A2690|nr:uncharacterized protein LOC129219042 [Uloborus diversus]